MSASVQSQSYTSPFSPSILNDQELGFFNRAIGHAYQAQKAWFGSTKKREVIAETSDINAVGILLKRRGINVSFKDIYAHVHGRATTLRNGHNTYIYDGISYNSYPINYYGNSFYATDNSLFAGILAFEAIELAERNNEVEYLREDGYFNNTEVIVETDNYPENNWDNSSDNSVDNSSNNDFSSNNDSFTSSDSLSDSGWSDSSSNDSSSSSSSSDWGSSSSDSSSSSWDSSSSDSSSSSDW